MNGSRWAFIFSSALVLIPIGIALGSRKKRPNSVGAVDPFEDTEEPEDEYRAKPPQDEGDCLVLGNEHLAHKFGRYRVCLTPNQKKTLFKGHKGKKLGCGVFACAYDTSSSTKAVKFTRDPEDVAALLEAQDTDVVPRVYDVYKIKNGGKSLKTGAETPVYALVVEKLKTFTPAEREAIDQELSSVPDVMREVETGQAGSIREACQAAEDCGPITQQVAEAAYTLRQAGIEWSDIHSGNIGMDKHGTVKILDLGITGTQLKEQPKILEGAKRRLHQRRLPGV
jgi:hypothetical protein